jgi:hypothetical protein
LQLTLYGLGGADVKGELMGPWYAGGGIGFGGYVNKNKTVALVGLVEGAYAPETKTADPNNRTTLANPADPQGLGSIVAAYDYRKAGLVDGQLELQFHPSKYFAVALSAGAGAVIETVKRDVSEELIYPNGDLFDRTAYSTEETRAKPVGVFGAGFVVYFNDTFGLRLNANVQTDGKNVGVGGSFGPSVRF